jgi:hypothetical protein
MQDGKILFYEVVKTMFEQKKLTIEDDVKNSDLSENLKNNIMKFVVFLTENKFSIESEDDGNGWKIIYMNECIGHMNFTNVGIWIDKSGFGSSGSADDVLKETTWAHVRICEYFSTGGKQCGCGNQPGFNKTIFGKEYKNLCFSLLEFINLDAKTLDNIKKLMLLFKQNKKNMQCS